jgi:hypothetical protein
MVRTSLLMTERAVKNEATRRIKRRVPVNIYLSDETGEMRYAVEDACDPGFWLNSFVQKSAAVNFVKRNGLTIIQDLSDLSKY